MPHIPDNPAGLQAELVRRGGVLKIAINGEVHEPLAFRSFRPEERNIREFYAAGVRLMSQLHTGLLCTLDVPYSHFGEIWLGPGQYDFAAFDRQMELFLKHAPEAYFNIMLELDTRDWYLRLHPECSNTYFNLVEMAGHEPWREDTAVFLQDMLRYIEGRYGDRVFAYSLFCGGSTEWFTNLQTSRPEAALRSHPLKEAAFRRWTGDPEAVLPPVEELHATAHGVLRDPVREAAALRYWRFHHEIIGDAIVYFAGRCQEVLDHRKLLGVFYGYLTQLDGPRLLQEGHLAYERVWRCPNLDMIFAPAKYGRPRDFAGASGYLLTPESLGLNDKLQFHECDHTTYIAPSEVENGRRIPGSDSRLEDELQSRMVLRREFAMTRARRTALWWFDFFGGYYYAAPLMQEVERMVAVQQRLKDLALRSVAQVAVFGDVGSMYYASARSPLAVDLLVRPPDALGRIGAPYDVYTLSDITREGIPWDQYRLLVFLNALSLPAETREFITAHLQREGRSLLWVYAPNYVQETGFAVEGIEAVTGMQVARRADADSRVTVAPAGAFAGLPASTQYSFSGDTAVTPLFASDDPEAEVWGRYVTDGAGALASRRFADYASWYTAVGNLPTAVWREVARAAGVHLYGETDDPLYVNNRLLGVHMQSGEDLELTLPATDGELEELFDGARVTVSGGRCRLPGERGLTQLYLLHGGEFAP